MGNAKSTTKKNKGGDEEKVDEELDNELRDAVRAEEAYSFWDRNKSFKPVCEPKGARQHQMHQTMKASLGQGELRQTVKLPDGEDENEWIAVNTVHFYNAANMIYGTSAEFCTEQSCPSMTAGQKYEYLWKDGVQYKKATRVSAPVYIGNLLNWANEQISDPAFFPIDDTAKFPRNFKKRVSVIYKRLFRMYAHIYYSHFEQIRRMGANAHLNTCFKHFCYFIKEFDLVPPEELAPLQKLIAKFEANP